MKIIDRDYSGKDVFVGIDVHKKTYTIAVSCDHSIVKKWSCTACPKSLANQLLKYFEGATIRSAYEAGFSGFSLHRVLKATGIKNIVVNAASIEVKANDRVKTDKKDAKKIAELLESRRLNGIYIPSESEEARRSISRGREQVVERRKAIGNQLKMKLHYLGYQHPKDIKLSEAFLVWAESLELLEDHRFAIDELIDAWRQETKRIKRYEKRLRQQAKEDKCEEIYRSVPGIGEISARVLANELGDTSRFSNEKQLFSSTGLTPGEYSSGDHVRKGHISRQGSPRIRAILVEVAWRAIAQDSGLRMFYVGIAQRRESKRAIIAVARKLLGRLRHCLLRNVTWQVV